MRPVLRLALGVSLWVGLVGCSIGPSSSAILACDAALIEGTLVAHPAEGMAIVGPGPATPIVWPRGYTIVSGDGRTDVRNERGNTVARLGDWVQLVGGLDEEGRWWVCGEPLQRR